MWVMPIACFSLLNCTQVRNPNSCRNLQRSCMVETKPIAFRLKDHKCARAVDQCAFDVWVSSVVNGQSETTSAHPQHKNLTAPLLA